MTGIELINKERERQIEVEGWTSDHDDRHSDGELASAARCYHRFDTSPSGPPRAWPWAARWWKPKDRLSNLIRAGALFRAEQDRLRRVIDDLTVRINEVAAEIDQLQGQG